MSPLVLSVPGTRHLEDKMMFLHLFVYCFMKVYPHSLSFFYLVLSIVHNSCKERFVSRFVKYTQLDKLEVSLRLLHSY